MNERAIFMEALDKDTLAERSVYLDEACGGDTALRQRVEALLTSHEQAGSFLGKPVPERLAEGLAASEESAETQGERPAAGGGERLDFLTPSDKPGSLGRLGHYEVHEVIGRGGMGVVLRAFDEQLHRVAAIKVMAPHMSADGAARQRFVREARAAAAVRDEHVVGIYAVEEGSATPYLVMEYIAGGSLQERLDRGGPLEVKEILRIGLQAANGLAAAHAQGLIHRDVKPANILLENGVERVKITDFGLARARADARLTQEGVVTGTPQYMAPEQARGEIVDHRADLFSLGSVLYALCTGRPPFRAENTLAVLKRVCEDAPPPIREINPDVPPWLVEIIAKLQAKDPAERFQSAREVAEVLGRELAALQRGDLERPPTPRPAPPAKRSRRLGVAAAAVLLLFAGGFVLTESTGITHLAATALRGFTPDHPPVVKVEEGRNDVQPAEPPALAPPDPLKPFVILANAARGEQSYETLAEAVAGARSGDTIELRGDGPFVNPPLDLEDKDLAIRAGPGFRPVLRLADERNQMKPHLTTRGRLVLEGLEFHVVVNVGPGMYSCAVQSDAAPLWMANCRFILKGGGGRFVRVFSAISATLQVRNCHIITEKGCYLGEWQCPSGGQMTYEGNVFIGPDSALAWSDERGAVKDVLLQLRRNTLCGSDGLGFAIYHLPEPVGDEGKQPNPPFRIEAAENVLDVDGVFVMTQFQMSAQPPPRQALSVAEADAVLRRMVDWREHRNVYGRTLSMPWQLNASGTTPNSRLTIRLSEWEQFWGLKDTGSLQGRIRFQSGVAPATPGLPVECLLDPQDFRLAPDSAGKGAGEDGRDLGADIDLVGPGPAYERWKKTPAYQQWLKDTGQIK